MIFQEALKRDPSQQSIKERSKLKFQEDRLWGLLGDGIIKNPRAVLKTMSKVKEDDIFKISYHKDFVFSIGPAGMFVCGHGYIGTPYDMQYFEESEVKRKEIEALRMTFRKNILLKRKKSIESTKDKDLNKRERKIKNDCLIVIKSDIKELQRYN